MWEQVFDFVIVGFIAGVIAFLARWARRKDGRTFVDLIERKLGIDIPDRLEGALASGLNAALDRAIDGAERWAVSIEQEKREKVASGEKLRMAVQIADSLTNRLGLHDLTGQALAALIESRLVERGVVEPDVVTTPMGPRSKAKAGSPS